MSLAGIDISGYQAATPPLTSRSFVIVKASEGLASDGMYAQHAANVTKAGLVLGAYHFARNDVSTPEEQARYFIAAATGSSFYALDVEGLHAFSNAQIGAFMAEMHRHGKTCGLYHSLSGFPTAGQDWNWVAVWGATPPSIPWTFWQYQGSPLDLDVFNGDLAALHALAGKDDVNLDKITYQSWTANGTDGVLRDKPDRSLVPSVTLPAGTPIISIGEYLAPDGNNWRAAEWPVGSHTVRWFLRYGPGIPADHDFIAGPFVSFGGDVLAAKQAGYDLAVTGVKVTNTPTVTFPPRPS